MPRLVELQQYPGFDHFKPTKLPHSVQVSEINEKIIKVQKNLDRKV